MKFHTVVPFSGALLAGLTPAIAAHAVVAPTAAARQAAAADVDGEPLSCVADALTAEEAAAGDHVSIVCAARPELALVQAARAGDVLMAVHSSGLGGTGSTLSVYGAADCSDVVVFGSSDPWNDAIESTRPRACGNVKHFAGSGLTGENEVVSGSTTTNLTTLRNRTSSIGYGT